jgi:hypothetical protein
MVSLKIRYEQMFPLGRSIETLQARGEFLLELGEDFTSLVTS